jgi:transmembrane sensor
MADLDRFDPVMSMHKRPKWEMLARFVTGECTETERSTLLAWAAMDPSHRAFLRELRRTWEASAYPTERWDVDSGLARVKSWSEGRRDTKAVVALPTLPRLRQRRFPRFSNARLAVAAVLVGLTLGGSFLMLRLRVGSDQVAVQRLVTEKGQRARVDLSDGSEVLLGPASRIEMVSGFGIDSREVRLTGEAYFDVVHDPARPFLVHVRGAVTRVLGTEFGIRAYPEDSAVRVVVAEGRVSLRATEGTDSAVAIVNAGELGELPSGDGPMVTRMVDLDVHLGWRNGRLTFEKAPLSDVAREIERWYGVPVRIDDPALGTLRLTATFRDQPIENVLHVVAVSLELEWVRVGEAYVFVPKRTASLSIR